MPNYERTKDFEERMNEHIRAKKLLRAGANSPPPIIQEEKSEMVIEDQPILAPQRSKASWTISTIVVILILLGVYFFLIAK